MKHLIKSVHKVTASPVDQIGKFWVVTYPTKLSELEDCCFEIDVRGLLLQGAGGLKPDDVAGVFKSSSQAVDLANKLLLKKLGER